MDEKNKIPENKKSIGVMEEFKDNLERRMSEIPEGKKSFTELALIFANEYTQAKAAHEARKSPEQRAYEAQQAALRAKATAIEKTKKEQIRCNELFKIWIKRDTWLVYDEAMPLIKAEKPDYETLFNPRNSEFWELVQSCAGHSLQLINPEAKPKQWRVKPFEWVRWLKEKEQYVHPQLEALIYPKSNIQPMLKTAKATNSREIAKRDRQKAIREFASQAEELFRKHHQEWDSKAIPVTKEDFLQVLEKVNPACKKISKDTFDRDIADIGLSFKRGTKSNKNNVLKTLFSNS